MKSRFTLNTVFFSFLFLSTLGQVPLKNITVFSIGNGNMAERSMTSNERGWMQMLPMFFSTNVHFNNDAIREKSAGEYLNEGHWNTVFSQLKEGDYVFISFDGDVTTGIQDKEKDQKAIAKFIANINEKK
jgi:hypothetical protein